MNETKFCKFCQTEKPITDFPLRSAKKTLRRGRCQSCENKAMAEYRKAHPKSPEQVDKIRKQQSEYRERERERIRAKRNQSWKENVNGEKDRVKAKRSALREEMIQAYGGKCTCCGEGHYEFLTLEHIHGGGNQHRKIKDQRVIMRELKSLGWPKGDYTVLCWNCNASRGIYGYCPHERERQNH